MPSMAPASTNLTDKPRAKGEKRARDEDEEGQAPAPPTSVISPTPAKRLRQEDAFRFLDLPAELQNRIYEYAAEITGHTWPIIRNRNFENRERERALSSSPNNDSESPPHQRFPFLGLTQTCTMIRVAFRGWWMDNHRVPLCELERYLSVFHPLPPKKDRHRFEAYVNTAGQLKIWIRKDDLHDKDVLRLLKLKLRLPNYTIIFQHGTDVKAEEAQGLSELVRNTNPEWLRLLRGRIVTQVRTTTNRDIPVLTVVVRVNHAHDWMRPTVGGPPPETKTFAKTLELDNLKYWTARFAVSYT